MTAASGVRLALRRFLVPPGVDGVRRRRGVVLATHAMMARGRVLRHLAAWLASQGFETWTLDFRGHGDSVPPDPHRDAWSFQAYVDEDLPAARAHVAAVAAVDVADVMLLGHSLGGLVSLAALAAGAPQPRRLVLVTTNVWTQGGLLRRLIAFVMVLLASIFGYLPARALRRGTDDEPRSYVREWASWLWSGRWPHADGLARVTTPILVVVGRRDWLCPEEGARALLAATSAPVEIAVADVDHFGLLTSPRGRQAWPRIAEFLGDREP